MSLPLYKNWDEKNKKSKKEQKKGKKVENDQKWNCFRKSNESEIIYVLISSAIFTYLLDKQPAFLI